MCDSNVGVAKRLDLENISKELSGLVQELDKEVEVDVNVEKIEKVRKALKKAIE